MKTLILPLLLLMVAGCAATPEREYLPGQTISRDPEAGAAQVTFFPGFQRDDEGELVAGFLQPAVGEYVFAPSFRRPESPVKAYDQPAPPVGNILQVQF